MIDDLRMAAIFYINWWSDTRRKRLRCASDFHQSTIVNRHSSIYHFPIWLRLVRVGGCGG